MTSMISSKHRLLNPVFAFLIGLFSSSNLVYLFVVGSTPILPLEVVSCVCFAYLFLTGQMNKNTAKTITKDLKYLFIGVILSIIPTILFNLQNFRLYVVGLVSVSFSVFTILDIVALKNHTKSLFAGIVFGIIVNAIFVAIEYVFYERTKASIGLNGTSFNFGDYFPLSQHATIWLSNPYAAKGLFKEQGHLMRYIAIFSLPLLVVVGNGCNKKVKLFMTILILVLAAMSRSATIAIFAFGLVVFFFILHTNSIKSFFKLFSILLLLLLLLLLLSRFVPRISNLLSSFSTGFFDLFSRDGSNSIRLQGMSYAFSIIKTYPITGAGLNSLTTLFMNYGYYGTNNIYGSYSALLTMIGELGVCSLFFVYFVIQKAWVLIKKSHSFYSIALGTSLLVFFLLFCLTDFNIDSSASVLLGLVLVEYKRVKQKAWINKKFISSTLNYYERLENCL